MIKNIVALITPFRSDGSIDYEGYGEFLKFLMKKSSKKFLKKLGLYERFGGKSSRGS